MRITGLNHRCVSLILLPIDSGRTGDNEKYAPIYGCMFPVIFLFSSIRTLTVGFGITPNLLTL